jgi:hypothetical protein
MAPDLTAATPNPRSRRTKDKSIVIARKRLSEMKEAGEKE